MKIKRKIIRQSTPLKNIAQLLQVPGSEDYIVVPEVRVFPICAEIDQKQRHAVIHGADFLAHNLGTRFAFQQYVIGVKNIGVADDDIKAFFSTLLGDDARNLTLSCHNLGHFRVEPDLPPEPEEQLD